VSPGERGPRRVLWLVLACCVATFVCKLVVNEPRTSVNHGDVAFYYTVARNLAEGRGFTIDYIWNFWDHPQGFPTPSNVWWMPLPSVICAAGMLLGGGDYAAAQLAMIVLTSVLPLLVWLLGLELFRDWRVALLGAVLSVTFHLFLDQPCAPLSHGPYLVLATLSLWLIVRSVRDHRCLPWAGAAIALTQLSRSDGILLFAPLLVTHLAHRTRPGWKRIALVPVAYAAVMAPWWGHNLVVHGALMPGGSFRAVFLREYEQWYALPESVTRENWLKDGWEPVLALKRAVSRNNLETAAVGLVAGAADRKGAFDHAALLAVLGLAWVGVLTTFRRACLPFWTQLSAEWTFYSLIFTAVGLESFRSGMFSVYPMLVLCAASGLLLLLRLPVALLPARWPRERVRLLLAAAVTAWIVVGQFVFAREALVRKAQGIDDLNRFYATFRNRVIAPHGLEDAVFMARDVHELHALTGLRCVQIPFEPERVIRATAQRFGVTHLLLMGEPGQPSTRPGLQYIDANPHYELIEGPARANGMTFRVYRIVE
jgi:hypothetical protein